MNMALHLDRVAMMAPVVLLLGSAPCAAASFPEMEIRRDCVPHEWAFSVDAGTLACVALGDVRAIIFSEPWRTDVPQEFGNMTPPRSVIVSANPMALLASAENRDLYLPFDSLETLIRRLAPFEAMGTKLCEADAASSPKN